MRVIKETRKYLICFCENHNDVHTPNLVINKVQIGNKPPGFAHCFSCGWTGWYDVNDFKEFIQTPAMFIKHPTPNWNQLQAHYETVYKNQRDYLQTPFSVRENTLEDFGIGWDGSSWTFPMFDGSNNICGIHRRLKNGFKCCVEGSKLGLFLSNVLVYDCGFYIVEGLSDACVINDLGFSAVGKPSAHVGNDILFEFLNHIGNHDRFIGGPIIVVGDDFNKPYEQSIGKQAASELAMDLILKGYDATVLNIQQIHGVKDVREYQNKYGRKLLEKLLKGS